MSSPPRRPLSWFLALALLSAAALLAIGFVGLWRAARDAERVARAEAQRGAALTARIVRSRLLDERALGSAGAAREFHLREGQLLLPESIGWLDEPPPELPELDLPASAADLVRDAERASAGDAAAAVAAFERALATPELSSRSRAWLLLTAAWDAHHRGDAGRRESWFEELLASVSGSFVEHYRSVVAGGVLLAAATGRELGEEWLRLGLGQLPCDRRDALFAEIAARAEVSDTSSTGGWSSPWRALAPAGFLAARDAADRTRDVLRRIRPLAPMLGGAKEPVIQAIGEQILVYWPKENAAGRGIVGPASELVPDVALAVGPSQPEDAAPVAAGIGVIAEAAPPIGFFARPAVIACALALLAATFALGLALALRSVRREAALTRARAEFLTSVTHELKTPLASIRLFSEMLLEGRVASDAKRGEYHRLLAGETARLSTLIENVLDLGRVEKGERALDLREQPLAEIVGDTLDRFAPLAQRDGLEIAVRLEEAPLLARVDRGALAQVVLNLLDNARKYAGRGRRVDVALGRAGACARLSVRDFGPGVPDAERAAIFEPFVRGERQKDGATPGLGLGLHLARSLLRAQGGELECLAPEDGGAGVSFVATLPLANASVAAAARAPDEEGTR